MSLSKDIKTYPFWCFQLVEAFLGGSTKVGIDFKAFNKGVRARQQFYMFRTLMDDDRAKAALAAVTVKLRPDGYCEFVHVDQDAPQLEILAQDPTLAQGAHIPDNLPKNPQDYVGYTDEQEQMLERMLKKQRLPPKGDDK